MSTILLTAIAYNKKTIVISCIHENVNNHAHSDDLLRTAREAEEEQERFEAISQYYCYWKNDLIGTHYTFLNIFYMLRLKSCRLGCAALQYSRRRL